MSKNITILGGGESGIGASLLAVRQGIRVFLSDKGNIQEPYRKELSENRIPFEEGGHSWDKIRQAEELVKSPGIPEHSEIMSKVRQLGIPVISEIELAYRYCGQSRIIAVSGSNGKSTTTSLAYYILKNSGMKAACVGNIGTSFARQVALNPVENYVVEVSSFQLDDIHSFRAHIAILLNITADHLDRYDQDMDLYTASKFRLVKNQTPEDYFIFCLDDPRIRKKMQTQPVVSKTLPFSIMETIKEGGYVDIPHMHLPLKGDDFTMSVYDLAIKGKHNWYNSMAAGIAARTMEIRKETIRESLISFKGLEHRLEFVATVRGVEFINDSKATNVNSVWFALESFQKPIILILGGVDKGNDYSLIRDLVREKVRAIVCLGLDNRKIHEALGKDVDLMINTASAREAVHAAFHFASKGDLVLLSPACASFDLFRNYEDRGKQFKKAVREL